MKWIDSAWTHISDTWTYRSEPERLRVLVESYWRMLLGTAGILILCAVVYGSVNLITALGSQNAKPTLTSGSGGAVLNRANLQATVSGFAERATKYELLKKNPLKLTDPSK